MSGPSSAPSAHNLHPRYRADVDGLRALAILPVVAYHAFPLAVPGGYVGVDVFFVISGFLISSIVFQSLQNGDFSFREFYARRIRRIFPALVLVLAVSFIAGWFTLLPDEYRQLGKHIAASAGFVQNVVLWREAGYFDTASELKPLLHLWSLAIEEQFYLVFPALLWLFWRTRLDIFVLIVVALLASFAANVVGTAGDPVGSFYLPHSRYWELLAGALLAHASVFPRQPRSVRPWALPFAFLHRVLCEQRTPMTANRLSMLGASLILAAIFLLGRDDPYPGWRALLPVVGTALVLGAGVGARLNAKILSRRPLVFIGVISYPLYLWHWPLLSFARILEGGTPSPALRTVAVGLSVALAWITYRFLERPIRFGRAKGWKTAGLSLAMLVIGFLGYNDYDRGGYAFPSRIKPIFLNNQQFQFRKLPSSALDKDRCLQRFPRFSAPCYLAKDGPPTVLLIGDSHAHALFSGLATATAENGDVNVLNLERDGHLPFVGVVNHGKTTSEKDRQDGAAAVGQMMSIAAENASVHTVIIASRGPYYLSGRGVGKDDGAIRLLDDPGVEDNRLVWRLGMERTITYLLEQKKQVIFVLDNPELNFDLSSCFSGATLLGAQARAVCAVPRAEFVARSREYRDLVATVLKRFPTVRIFDSAAPLCDEQWCWAMRDGKLLYMDSDHLSAAGSELIGEELAALVAAGRR